MGERPGEEASGGERLGLAGVGIAAMVVVCCATLPLLAGVASGVAVGTVLGVGAGIVVAVAVVAAVIGRARRRRADCAEGTSTRSV